MYLSPLFLSPFSYKAYYIDFVTHLWYFKFSLQQLILGVQNETCRDYYFRWRLRRT